MFLSKVPEIGIHSKPPESSKVFSPMAVSVNKNKESPYLVTLIDILSFILIVPFKLDRKSKTGEHFFVTSRFRRTISFILNLLLSISHIVWIVFLLSNYASHKYDLSLAFYNASVLSTIGGVTTLQCIAWKGREDLLRFIEMTSVEDSTTSARKKKLKTLLIMGAVFISSIFQGSASDIGGVEAGQFCKFIGNFFKRFCRSVGLSQIGTLPYHPILNLIGTISYCLAVAVFNSIISLMMVLSLTFRNVIVNHYCPSLKRSCGDVPEIMEHYKMLKELTMLTRNLFGPFILFVYICVLAFIAQLPMLFSSDQKTYTILLMGFILVMSGGGVWIAVSCHSKIEECLRPCIANHHWEDDCQAKERLKLLALGHDMDREPIGISCSFFTFTKSFLASTFSLVVTYSIIVYQMMDKERL